MAPVRLAKVEEKKGMNAFEAWLNRHAFLFIIIGMCILIALLVTLCFVLIGSCTDSGTVYNQMSRII